MMRLKRADYYVLTVTVIKTVLLLGCCLNSSGLAQSTRTVPLKESELLVQKQVKEGQEADLCGIGSGDECQSKREISSAFLINLLKNFNVEDNVLSYGIHISNAVITGDLTLYEVAVPFRLSLENCVFKGNVNFSRSEFQKGLSIRRSRFEAGSNFYEMKVDGNLRANKAQFLDKTEPTNFDSINVSGTVYFYETIFEGPFILRDSIMSRLQCNNTEFRNQDVKFKDEQADFFGIKVNDWAYFQNTSFAGHANFNSIDIGTDVDLTGARFNNPFDMSGADIKGNLDFTNTTLAANNRLTDMAYGAILAESEEKLEALIDTAEYSPEAYASLEAYYKRMGDEETADDVYVAGRQRERDVKFQQRGFRYLPQYLWSWILFITVGYGRELSRALLWSILLIGVGYFVFRKEKYMTAQNEDDAERYQGRYHPLWYSIALFLPIVNLADAQIWMPKMERRKSRFYMRLHIILGYLLIPIGLAAWTGLIS